MHFITLDRDTDFEGWRKAARALVLNDINPSDVTWTTPGQAPELFEPSTATPLPDAPQASLQATFNVSAKFVELAQSAILHRDLERFAILYRLLWRLRSHHDLLAIGMNLLWLALPMLLAFSAGLASVRATNVVNGKLNDCWRSG